MDAEEVSDLRSLILILNAYILDRQWCKVSSDKVDSAQTSQKKKKTFLIRRTCKKARAHFIVSMTKFCILGYPKFVYWRFWSDCANLNLRLTSICPNVRLRLRVKYTWQRMCLKLKIVMRHIWPNSDEKEKLSRFEDFKIAFMVPLFFNIKWSFMMSWSLD